MVEDAKGRALVVVLVDIPEDADLFGRLAVDFRPVRFGVCDRWHGGARLGTRDWPTWITREQGGISLVKASILTSLGHPHG